MTVAPTRRGIAVLLITVGATVLGFQYGGRSLDPIVVSGLITIVVTGAFIRWIDEPRVDLNLPNNAHRGESVTARISVESDYPYPGRVTVSHSPEIDGDVSVARMTDGEPVSIDLSLPRRGVFEFSDARIVATDPFGLWQRSFAVAVHESIVVYPAIRSLSGLDSIVEPVRESELREHIVGIRQYAPGDPFTDINWKKSARHPDSLYLTEFAGTRGPGSIRLGVDSSGYLADEVADAAASVAVHLLSQGSTVGLCTPDVCVEPGAASGQREAILSALATFDGGSSDETCAHDTAVVFEAHGPGSQVTIRIEDGGDPSKARTRRLVTGGTR